MLAYIAFFTLCRFFFCEFRFSLLFVRRIFFFCFCFSVFGCVLVYWAGVTFFHAENRSFFLFFPFRLNHVAESPSLPHKYSFLLFFFSFVWQPRVLSIHSIFEFVCPLAFLGGTKKDETRFFLVQYWIRAGLMMMAAIGMAGWWPTSTTRFPWLLPITLLHFFGAKNASTLCLSLFLFLKLNLLFSKRFPS